jgi:aryl-alcohol dehydrogenase-like predicted oxidoreductase
MRRIQLGSSPLRATGATLGCMSFGVQNTEGEAHAMMDHFFERGHVMLVRFCARRHDRAAAARLSLM